MVDFAEGTRWRAYGEGGFYDKNSLTIEVDERTVAGVTPWNKGFIAMSALTGAALTHIVDLETAVAAAEAEALKPAQP